MNPHRTLRETRASVRGGDRVRKRAIKGRHVTKLRAINFDSDTAPVSEDEIADEKWSTPNPTGSSSIRSTKEGRRRRSSVSGENVSEPEGDVLEDLHPLN